MKRQLPSSVFPNPTHSSRPRKYQSCTSIIFFSCCSFHSLNKPFGESPEGTQTNGAVTGLIISAMASAHCCDIDSYVSATKSCMVIFLKDFEKYENSLKLNPKVKNVS